MSITETITERSSALKIEIQTTATSDSKAPLEHAVNRPAANRQELVAVSSTHSMEAPAVTSICTKPERNRVRGMTRVTGRPSLARKSAYCGSDITPKLHSRPRPLSLTLPMLHPLSRDATACGAPYMFQMDALDRPNHDSMQVPLPNCEFCRCCMPTCRDSQFRSPVTVDTGM